MKVIMRCSYHLHNANVVREQLVHADPKMVKIGDRCIKEAVGYLGLGVHAAIGARGCLKKYFCLKNGGGCFFYLIFYTWAFFGLLPTEVARPIIRYFENEMGTGKL